MQALTVIGLIIATIMFAVGGCVGLVTWMELGSYRPDSQRYQRYRRNARIGGAAAVLGGALLALLIVAYVHHSHDYPSTASQANKACHTHGGVAELVAPGEDGAYVICRDGHIARTRSGSYWR